MISIPCAFVVDVSYPQSIGKAISTAAEPDRLEETIKSLNRWAKAHFEEFPVER